jgi:endoglucanase
MRARVGELVARGPLNYYNGVLTLFGEGALEDRYQFTARGRLQPDWSTRCSAGTH